MWRLQQAVIMSWQQQTASGLMLDLVAAADIPESGMAADAPSEKAQAAHKTGNEELQHHENRLGADKAAVSTAPVADSSAGLEGSSWRSLLRLDQQSDMAAGDIASKEEAAVGSSIASTPPEQEEAAWPVSCCQLLSKQWRPSDCHEMCRQAPSRLHT